MTDKKSRSERSKRTHARGILSAFLSAATLFSCVSCSFGRRSERDDNKKTPIDSDTVLSGDGDSVYGSLRSETDESIYVYPTLSHDKVKEMLRAIVPPTRYSWYYTTELYSSTDSLSRKGIFSYVDGNMRVELYDKDDRLLKTVLTEEGVLYSESGEKRTELSTDHNSFFVEAGMVSIDTFLNDTGDDFAYRLLDSDYGTVLFASFFSEKGTYSQRQEYSVSLDYGVVLSADCYENEALIYHLETNALYELDNEPF